MKIPQVAAPVTDAAQRFTIFEGDARIVGPSLKSEQFHAIVTSPPY